jgi:hypothetical protein
MEWAGTGTCPYRFPRLSRGGGQGVVWDLIIPSVLNHPLAPSLDKEGEHTRNMVCRVFAVMLCGGFCGFAVGADRRVCPWLLPHSYVCCVANMGAHQCASTGGYVPLVQCPPSFQLSSEGWWAMPTLTALAIL